MVKTLTSPPATMPPERVRRARVGDLLPMRLLHNGLDRRILATACPECGVPDDPTDRDWVP